MLFFKMLKLFFKQPTLQELFPLKPHEFVPLTSPFKPLKLHNFVPMTLRKFVLLKLFVKLLKLQEFVPLRYSVKTTP